MFLWEQRWRDGLVSVLLSEAMVHRDRNRRRDMPERNEIRELTDEALDAVAGGWAIFVAAALQYQERQREELYCCRV